MDANFKGEKLPALRDVLTLAAPCENLFLNVEIKDMANETVDVTVAILYEFGIANRAVIACFYAAVIRYVKKRIPKCARKEFPADI